MPQISHLATWVRRELKLKPPPHTLTSSGFATIHPEEPDHLLSTAVVAHPIERGLDDSWTGAFCMMARLWRRGEVMWEKSLEVG